MPTMTERYPVRQIIGATTILRVEKISGSNELVVLPLPAISTSPMTMVTQAPRIIM
jgi:hypothetical protein